MLTLTPNPTWVGPCLTPAIRQCWWMLINADLLHQKVAPKGPDQRPGEDHRDQFFGGKNVLGLWSDFQMDCLWRQMYRRCSLSNCWWFRGFPTAGVYRSVSCDEQPNLKKSRIHSVIVCVCVYKSQHFGAMMPRFSEKKKKKKNKRRVELREVEYIPRGELKKSEKHFDWHV